jgi:formylglycine-generating enzyme required for sulfatase activity
MGSDDPGWSRPDELPVHEVNIGYDFYIGKYEVTQAQWKAVMQTSPSHFKGDNLPVEMVNWDYCQIFITELNGITGGKFRLPSEAEWEYACRAGTTTRFYFGDSTCPRDTCSPCDLDDYTWWCGNSGDATHPVGGKLPNDWGLYDMHGNVWEWCQDWYHDSYAGAPADGSAWESTAGGTRVLRGGSWENPPMVSRSALRYHQIPSGMGVEDNGFRLCRTRSRTP